MKAKLLVPSFLAILATVALPAAERPAGNASASAPATAVRSAALPQWDGPTATEYLEKRGGFTQFLELLRNTGFYARLSRGGPYTMLAVSDDVLAKLPPERRAALLAPEAVAQKRVNGMFFVLRDAWPSAELFDTEVLTLAGFRLPVTVKDGAIRFQDAVVVEKDIKVGNGIVHVIDRPLAPPPAPAPRPAAAKAPESSSPASR